MSIFQRLFGNDRSVPENNVEALVQYVRKWGPSKWREEKVPRALRTLGNFPSSEEALEFLLSWAGIGSDASPTTLAAIEGLALMGHPRAIRSLVKISKKGSMSSSEKAYEALRQSHNREGISILLDGALTDSWPVDVTAALSALRHIGTPEAFAAIEEFRRTPSRQLYVQYFETPEKTFSSYLGQPPGDYEWQEVRRALGNDIRWGKREDVLNAVRGLLQLQKVDNVRVLRQVEDFLNNDNPEVPYPQISKLTAYPSELTKQGIEFIINSGLVDVPGRKKAIRDLIASSDVTALRTFLSDQEDGTKHYKTICSLVGIGVRDEGTVNLTLRKDARRNRGIVNLTP
jgi:HEAT repeat protein